MNNPLKYTDSTGEFWHLIIGTVIGGVINWVTHGTEFSWKGLGYFGVGAVAGALGAGVGAGVSSALAGGSFGAGFIGSSTAMTATTSFTTGAAIGGSAGFSSGFTTDFGNRLIQGQNFGDAIWSGTKTGLIAGASGALLGGVVGGIDAIKDGRNFWNCDSWEVTYDYQLPSTWSSPDGDLPIHNQTDPSVGCTQKTLESMADYRMQDFDIPIDGSADFRELAESWGYEVNRNYNNVHRIGSQILKGNLSAITYNNGGVQHTVGINRIQVMRTTRLFGNGFRYKNIITVMNPLVKDSYYRLSNSLFNSGVIRTLGRYHGFVKVF